MVFDAAGNNVLVIEHHPVKVAFPVLLSIDEVHVTAISAEVDESREIGVLNAILSAKDQRMPRLGEAFLSVQEEGPLPQREGGGNGCGEIGFAVTGIAAEQSQPAQWEVWVPEVVHSLPLYIRRAPDDRPKFPPGRERVGFG